MKNKEVPVRENDDGYFGRVFERDMGVKENNSSGPDLAEDGIELKSKKAGSKSRDTLFSKEPIYDTDNLFRGSSDLLDVYKNSKGKLNSVMRFGKENMNNRGFYLDRSVDGNNLYIFNASRKAPLARWSVLDLLDKAEGKLPNINKAIFSDEENYVQNEYRDFSKEKFEKLLFSGAIVVEFRMRDGELSGKKAKNRGTAFRINPERLKELYSTVREA